MLGKVVGNRRMTSSKVDIAIMDTLLEDQVNQVGREHPGENYLCGSKDYVP